MKVLILGYGSIGRRHAAVLTELVDVGVVEVSNELRDRARAGGVQPVFDSIETGMAWNPDAVVIATPTNLHADCYRTVASFGLPTLIEKPIANAEQDIAYFETLGPDEAGRIVVMANMRFHAGPETLHANLSRVGRPVSAYAHFGSYLPDMRPGVDYRTVYAAHRDQGGGVLLDSIHELDYMWWLFGEPTVVGGHLSKLSSLDMDVEDHAVTVLNHASGLRSVIELDYLQRHKLRSCRVTGDAGTLVWQSRAKAPEIVDVSFFTAEQRDPETLFQDASYDLNVAYGKYLHAFLTFVRTGTWGRLLGATAAAREASLLLSVIAQSNLNEQV